MFCCKNNDAVVVGEQAPGTTGKSLKTETDDSCQGFFTDDDGKILTGDQTSKDSASSADETKSKSSSEAIAPVEEEFEKVVLENPAHTLNENTVLSPKYSAIHHQLSPCSSDDITTLYEEPPRVPKDAFVFLPDDPQRGYESEEDVAYGPKDEWKKAKPYRISTLVWYRAHQNAEEGDKKIKFYIPAVIRDLIYSLEDKNQVVGYEIGVDTSDVPKGYNSDAFDNVEPENVMFRWNEVTTPCPVKGINFQVPEEKAEDRVAKLVEEYGDDLGFRGSKQNDLGPHMWGISMEQLQFVKTDKNFDDKMSMHDVVDTIIKPKTADTGMGYAMLLNQDKPLRAKVMVSHAWNANYSHFLESLKQSGNEGPFWICAMSMCQNNDTEDVTIEKQLGPDPHFGPLATVLKQADSMIAVMTSDCDIFTRLWCVYEIFIAITLNIPVTLESFNENTGNLVLDSTEKAVDTSQAMCGYEGDKMMIYREISKLAGGFGLVDDVVMWVKIKSLIDDMTKCTAESVNETQFDAQTGASAASNTAARQNAGIAAAMKVWQEAKNTRNNNDVIAMSRMPTLPTKLTTLSSIHQINSAENRDVEGKGSDQFVDEEYGYFSTWRDKLCC